MATYFDISRQISRRLSVRFFYLSLNVDVRENTDPGKLTSLKLLSDKERVSSTGFIFSENTDSGSSSSRR